MDPHFGEKLQDMLREKREQKKRELDNEQRIYECIEKLVNKLEKSKKDIYTPMLFSDSEKEYRIPRWDFLFYLANFINNNDLVYIEELKLPSYMDLVYSLAGVENKCSLNVNYFKQYLQNPHVIPNLLKLKLKNSRYCSLRLIFQSGLENHANMLFIDNSKSDVVDMYLYEPHGYDYINGDVKSFLDTISSFYNLYNKKRPLELVKYEDFSLNKGIQFFIPEIKENKKGYCVNYSYFWIYLILHCSKCLPDIPIEHIVKNTKLFYKVILAKKGSPDKNMSNIVHSFVNNIVSEFMDKVARLKYPEQEKINRKINNYILDNMPISKYYSRPKDLDLEDLYESDEEGDFNFSKKPARKPRKSTRKSRKSPRKLRKSLRKSRKSPRKPRKSARTPRKSARTPRKSPRKPRKSLRKPRKPRKSLRKPRKSLRKSPRKPRKSTRKSRK